MDVVERSGDEDNSCDAGLVFIGRIHTPWRDRSSCPRNASESEATARIVLEAPYRPGLGSLDTISHVILLYWLHQARRDIVEIVPPTDTRAHGVFATRAPVRPNPIGLSVSQIVSVHADGLTVTGIDCLDGTPLLDIKPYFASVDAKPEARVGWYETRPNPLPPRG
ncbi:tRNA (N6-threonylcarbamoyladenosine(37)-N6)-methyltransferase TrmO [Amorphus orientalis]|uniref:tRNA-Thr(GGU) m(6)t(6)A37 methyltransferase TsaA n=1 Tax=Amorphus orientalis TaxID=649198 RepID=A0AAE3VRY9_9HYPH|nr:tRNA (N6-threonylcarbamoyladenosine(37)-N6)-methyltransferase TrmO [Amorphus orientalis]MDQ0316566.1 tRNA-Thr(GGU) m(6)t(6)A37 methyltransferase TsaA [Amorphus orientalis]